MIDRMLLLNRRRLIASSLAPSLILVASRGYADVLTGIDALDKPAIRVKRPASVVLEAIAVAGKRLVAVGEHGVIIYSDDNAVTWAQAAVPVNLTLTCVNFITPMRGWVAGHFGVILNTVDGGITWKLQLNGLEANQLTLKAAQDSVVQDSTSPTAGFALKRAAVFVQDGPNLPFLSILAVNENRVIVFGAYRMTMITNDGGETWQDWSLNVMDRLSQNLYDVFSFGPNIYLVGESGVVFRSVDNGSSFLPAASPSAVTLFGVVVAKDASIVVFGVAGNCFRSGDGGLSWVEIPLGTQDNLTAGLVLRSGTILVGSEGGACFTSRDNGLTFGPVAGIPPMSIFGVVEDFDKNLIFVGAAGVTRVSETTLQS